MNQTIDSFRQVADVRTNLNRERQQEAHSYYVLGLHCLELGRRRGFKDKKILKQCCELFAESIRRDRQRPEPYVKLAYLLAMMQAWDQALPYLHQALILAPGHREALALQAFIFQKTSTPPSSGQTATEQFCLLDF